MMQRLAAAQAQYDAAEAAFTNLPLVASLGEALHALQQESAQLPLSEEDYLTLLERRSALVQRVTDRCKNLIQEQLFDDLARLDTQLKATKALVIAAAPVPTRRAATVGKNFFTLFSLLSDWVLLSTTLL
jgi:hypothetical protein